MNDVSMLHDYLRRQDFNPGWSGAFVNPFFIARRGLWRQMHAFGPALSGRLLDVGCGSKPYRELLRVREYVGLEVDTPTSQQTESEYYYDGGDFPFQDGSFDCVLCNQVLEHVFTPDRFLAEIHRVLMPCGKLLLTTPFVWDEHEQPRDYARYSSFGLHALLQDHGFGILRYEKIGSDLSAIAQLVNAYIFKIVASSRNISRLTCIFVMGPVSLLGLLFAKVLPSNPDLFLDHIVLAEKQ